MADSVPFEIASTIQTASINRHPDPRHDLNPSTAASKREPVTISSDDISDVGEDEIPLSVLRPLPRRHTLPPLPDLRFEQSYLRSIEKADTWAKVAWITFRDQACRLMSFECGLCAN
jgi:Autophagy receptor ATG43